MNEKKLSHYGFFYVCTMSQLLGIWDVSGTLVYIKKKKR